MPIKKTKEFDLNNSKRVDKKVESKIISKNDIQETTEKNAKKRENKVVIKRRKSELKPTRASAVAIASQANRAKKQALIKKMEKLDVIPVKKTETSDTKIPLWVWMFFAFSLMLFCISFYQAIIRPQLISENVLSDNSISWVNDSVNNGGNSQEIENIDESIGETIKGNEETERIENQKLNIQRTAMDTVVDFFNYLSDRNFDSAFDLMIPALRGYPDIKNHFTSFRMDPFLDGIEGGKLVPKNIEYIKSPSYGKDIYNFDLSYVMKSNQELYEEIWEFGINTSSGEPKISSIRCISSKCSYHPIFWPENFGLMR